MSIAHGRAVRQFGRTILDRFRSDPAVAEMLDPAILISDDKDNLYVDIIEYLELIGLLSGATKNEDANPHATNPDIFLQENFVMVAVILGNDIMTFCCPDPRSQPECWPWLDHSALLDD